MRFPSAQRPAADQPNQQEEGGRQPGTEPRIFHWEAPRPSRADLRRDLSPYFSAFPSDGRISSFPEGSHAVSSQLSVWLPLNAEQLYIIKSCYSSRGAPPGSAPHPPKSSSGACYTLMANSCGMSMRSCPPGEFRCDINGVRGRLKSITTLTTRPKV